MTEPLRVSAFVFVAAILQVSFFSSVVVAGGSPDLLLVLVVCVALLRGSLVGACAGFAGGLVVDAATLGTLGLTSLLLTTAGYWSGRYGETTGRDRPHAPLLAVVAITLLVGIAAYLLHFLLGDGISAKHALVTTLVPALGLNLIVAAAVWPLCTRLLPARSPLRHQREVELVV